jgi:membrane protein required for colicin V production
MISFADFTSFDVIVALVFILFIVRGGWIGFMRQLAAFLALVGSYWLAGRYCSQLMPYVDDFIHNPKLVFFVSFALLFCLSALLFILGGKVLHRVMEISLLGWFDRLLGILLGVVKGIVLTSFLYMILASSLSASNDLLKKSISAPYLAMGADILHQLIQDPQLRKYFVPREPAIRDGTLNKKKTGKKAIQPDPVPQK